LFKKIDTSNGLGVMTYDEISKRLAGGGSDGEDNDGIFSDEGDEEWDSENEVDE
jgi:hypothetical protein